MMQSIGVTSHCPYVDPSEIGTTSLQGHLLWHHANTLVYCDIGTTSLQGAKLLPHKCPSFGGSTVQFSLCRLTVIAHVGCESIRDTCELVHLASTSLSDGMIATPCLSGPARREKWSQRYCRDAYHLLQATIHW